MNRTKEPEPSNSVQVLGGGAKGTRTPGLCVANASLYQLSYNPAITRFFDSDTGGEERAEVVEVGRIELPSDTDRQSFLQV